MTTATPPTAAPTFVLAAKRPPTRTGNGAIAQKGMSRTRKISLLAGVLYLITFAASLPQLILFSHLIDDPSRFISGHGSNAAVLGGSLLEIVTAIAGVGTAVVLYPVTRRISRSAAIGFVASRIVEAALIGVGVVSVLALVTLKTHFAGAAGAQADSLRVTGEALVSIRQWTFLVGPGTVAGINGLCLAYVMYRGGLVPRIIPTIGLIGAPLILISASATILGGWGQTSALGVLFGLPIAVWELSLGSYLTVKGFKAVPAAATEV